MARNFETIFRIAGQIASSFPNSIRSASSALDNLHDRASAARESLAGLDRAAKAGLVFGAAVAAGAGLAVKAYAEAESAATDLKSSLMIADGTVSKDFEKINKLAGELGAKLPGSTAEFTKMMDVLLKEGISSKQVLDGMGKSAAYLAVVMKMDFPESAKFVAQLADATKVASDDMMDFMDQIQRMSHTGLDADYMLQGFVKMSAGMKTARMEGIKGVKAMAPLLAMLGNSGMTDGGSAGNAISKIMAATVKESKFFKEFGKHAPKLKLMEKGEFAGIETMYKELNKLKALTTQERNFYMSQQFGNDAETIFAINTIIDKGQAGYNEMVSKMAKQANLEQRVAVQLGTLANLWDAAKGAFDAVLIAVGESFADELKALVTGLSDVQDKLLQWREANPELFNQIVKGTLIVAGVVSAVSALALGIIALIGPFILAKSAIMGAFGVVMKLFSGLRYLSTALPWIISIAKWMASGLWIKAIALIKMLGTAFMWLGRVFLMNPIGLAITAIIVAIGLLYYNWDTVSKFLVSSWGAIKAGFSAGVAWIKQTFTGVMAWFQSLPSKFTEFGKNMIQGLINGITGMISAVTDKVKSVADSITNTVKGAFGIHSPSRVFAQLGEYNMQGLANGMDSSAGLPQRAASSAAYGSIPSMPSSGSSLAPTGGGGSTLQLTQYITVGSGDAAEQAKKGAASGAQDMLTAYREMKAREARLSF